MKAALLALFLLPVLLFTALACGGGEADPPTVAPPTQPTVSQPTTAADPEVTRLAEETPESTAPAPTTEPAATTAPAVPPTAAPAETVEAPAPTDTPEPQPTPEPTDAPTPVPTEETPTADPEPVEEPDESGPGPDSFIVGEGSQIAFTVEEELNRTPVRFDAVISGTGLTGFANLDGSPSVIMLDLHSLESDQNFRDRYIRQRMFPNTPEATVTFNQLPDLPQSFFDGEVTLGTLDGSLQIGETATPLTFDVEARHDGNVINVLGKTTFTWDELGLSKPVFGPVAYLADEVRVQVLIVAREQ